MSGADVWRVIRTNLWLIVLLVAAFGVGGYFVNGYLAKHYPRFTSSGYVLVKTNSEVNPFTPSGGIDVAGQPILQEQTTQAKQLMHESLLTEVLSRPDSKIRETRWFRQFNGNIEAAKEDLLDHLRVQPVGDSRLVAVSMQYSVPEDCRTIVQEIVDRHLEKQKVGINTDFLNKMVPLKQRIQTTADFTLKNVRRKISEQQVRGAGTSTAVAQSELLGVLADRSRVDEDLAVAGGKYQNLLALNQAGLDPPGLEARLQEHQGYTNLQQQLDNVSIELDSTPGGPNNTRVQKQTALKRGYERKIEALRDTIKLGMFDDLSQKYQGEVEVKQRRAKDLEQREQRLREEIKMSEAARTELVSLQSEAEALSKQLEEDKRELARLESVVGTPRFATAEWATNPNLPETPSFPTLKVTLPASILLGLALSLGIAFLRELTDNTVRSPRDIARVGQLNLLGMIPHENDDRQAAGARLPLVIFDAPQSALAEQFRQVRSRLQHAAALDTTRSLLVTGASAGDGKTVVACNLAAGLALNGRRILLVDANFRRPDLHNVFGTGNEVGFSDVLNNVDAFAECVRQTEVPNLDVLGSGPRPANPTELLESQLLTDFIERALEEYDHVVFDSGPLPLVSETIALAPRVDGVVTVVKARNNSRGLLQRVRDTLRQVKAEHLGVVLNAVRSQAGGYYGRNILDHYKYQNGAA